MLAKVMPAPSRIGTASHMRGVRLMSSAQITPMMMVTENSALKPAHSISASTTSSSCTGVLRMPSQVFCTCMREKAEYSASKLAAFMALMHTEPLARYRM